MAANTVDLERCINNRNHTGASLNTILRITIENCEGLKDVDFMGKSDPFVCLEQFNGHTLPGVSDSAAGKARGRVIANNLDPDFNETFYFLAGSNVSRCKLVV